MIIWLWYFLFSILLQQLGFYSNCFYFYARRIRNTREMCTFLTLEVYLLVVITTRWLAKLVVDLERKQKKVQTVVKQYYENYHTLVLSLQILFWWQTSSTKRFANASSLNCNCDYNKPHNHFFVIYICLVTQYFFTLKVLIMHTATKYASWHNRKYWQEKWRFNV